MRAFSLRSLLIAVAVVALWMVILARPSLFWMRLALTGTLLTLGWWLVTAIVAPDERRRFGVGAATIGIGYLALVFGGHTQSGFQSQEAYVLGRSLLTHQMLEGAAKSAGKQYPVQINNLSLWDSQLFTDMSYVAVPATGATPGGTTPAAAAGGFGPGGFGGGTFVGGGFGGPVTFRAVPGANPQARYQWYLISGHCLFAILFGWIAGRAAQRWLKPTSEQLSLPPASTPA